MSEDTIQKLALMLAEAISSVSRLTEEVRMLRREMLQLKDTCRGCAGFQDDGE